MVALVAGGDLSKALSDPTSLTVIGVGAGLTSLVSVVTLVVGYKFLNIPFADLSGMLASVQTQPAVLAFVNERTKNDTANISYANIYPVAMTKGSFSPRLSHGCSNSLPIG